VIGALVLRAFFVVCLDLLQTLLIEQVVRRIKGKALGLAVAVARGGDGNRFLKNKRCRR